MSRKFTYYGVTSYPTSIVVDSMILHLDAGDLASYPMTGSNWFDLTTPSSDFTNSSEFIWSPTNGGSFLCNNNGHSVTTQVSSQFSQNTMSFEVWCKPTILSSSGHIIFMDRAVYSDPTGSQIYSAGRRIFIRGSDAQQAYTLQEVLSINNWYQIVVVFNSSNVKIYLNSVEQTLDTNTIAAINPSGSPLYIGKYPSINSTYNYAGYLSIVRVYQKALSQVEITKNFNANKGRFGL